MEFFSELEVMLASILACLSLVKQIRQAILAEVKAIFIKPLIQALQWLGVLKKPATLTLVFACSDHVRPSIGGNVKVVKTRYLKSNKEIQSAALLLASEVKLASAMYDQVELIIATPVSLAYQAGTLVGHVCGNVRVMYYNGTTYSKLPVPSRSALA